MVGLMMIRSGAKVQVETKPSPGSSSENLEKPKPAS